MKLFLQKKVENLKNESRISNQHWLVLFLKKGTYRIYTFTLTWFDILSLILSIPVISFLLLPLVILFRHQTKIAIFYGLEHVIQKVVTRAITLENAGFADTHYFSLSTQVKTSIGSNRIHKILPSTLFNVFYYIWALYKYNPIYIEVYTEGKLLNQVMVLLINKCLKRHSIVIERGYLYQYRDGTFTFWDKFLLRSLYKLSFKIYYRETYMPQIFESIGIPLAKLHFDYNRVPVTPYSVNMCKKPMVLFLNGFKLWRNMDLVVQAMPTVLKQVPNAFFQFVGANNEQQIIYYSNLCKELGILESNFNFQLWTNSPNQFYEQAQLFVLPADLIFCNYSLLEAMERGVVPIVSDVEDADKIVQHQINGICCERKSDVIAYHIIDLLSNDEKRNQYSIESHKHIEHHFNDAGRMDDILKHFN